jgi:hypothetical protein
MSLNAAARTLTLVRPRHRDALAVAPPRDALRCCREAGYGPNDPHREEPAHGHGRDARGDDRDAEGEQEGLVEGLVEVPRDVPGDDAERVAHVLAKEAGGDGERDQRRRRGSGDDDEELGEEQLPDEAPARRPGHSPVPIP